MIPDELIAGAIDMHVHGYPDMSLNWKTSVDDVEMVRLGQAAGERGIVLKSHFWPTMDRARYLNAGVATGGSPYTVFPSITLNPIVGGILPITVDAAIKHGARVVFLPTWGCNNDHCEVGFVRRNILDVEYPAFAPYLNEHAVQVVDDGGVPLPAIREIIALCRDAGICIFTGHVSSTESLAIARVAAEMGFSKLVFSHPCSPSIHADVDQMIRMADLGATVEFTPIAPDRQIETYGMIKKIGAHRCILSTDTFSIWNAPQPEGLRMFAQRLHFFGCTPAEITTMVAENPARLCGV